MSKPAGANNASSIIMDQSNGGRENWVARNEERPGSLLGRSVMETSGARNDDVANDAASSSALPVPYIRVPPPHLREQVSAVTGASRDLDLLVPHMYPTQLEGLDNVEHPVLNDMQGNNGGRALRDVLAAENPVSTREDHQVRDIRKNPSDRMMNDVKALRSEDTCTLEKGEYGNRSSREPLRIQVAQVGLPSTVANDAAVMTMDNSKAIQADAVAFRQLTAAGNVSEVTPTILDRKATRGDTDMYGELKYAAAANGVSMHIQAWPGLGVGVAPQEQPSSTERASSTERSRLHSTSIPGAFRTSGASESREDVQHEDLSEDGNVPPAQVESRTDDEVNKLVVARAVDEENLHSSDLPQARPESSTRRRHETKTLDSTGCFALIVGIIIIAVVVALVSTLTNRGSISHSDQSQSVVEEVPDDPQYHSTEDFMRSLLPTYTVDALIDPSSPQSRAFQWMVEDLNATAISSDRAIQRYALATLYYATGGETWLQNDLWLNHSVHECLWYNAPLFAMTDFLGSLYPGMLSEFAATSLTANCDSTSGLHKHLWLDRNNLLGSLPPELFLLTSLETMSFCFNGLEGTISTHIGALSNLEGFAIFGLQDGGAIPSEVGLLKKLKGLALIDNSHQGSVPSEVFQLSNLQSLIVTKNPELQSTLPTEVGNLSQLRWLVLDDNKYHGTIPSEVGKVTAMEWFVLSRNQFSGTVPTEIGVLSNVTLFTLGTNQFTGAMPTELGALTAATLLNLQENQITGSIPSQLGLLTDLTLTLSLHQNQCTGSIPSELAQLPLLRELLIGANHLSGTIPSELALLTSLGWLSLHDTLVSGEIPFELSALRTSLYSLALEGSPLLSGTLPEPLCNISGACIAELASLSPCREEEFGLSFDCTTQFSGCGCTP